MESTTERKEEATEGLLQVGSFRNFRDSLVFFFLFNLYFYWIKVPFAMRNFNDKLRAIGPRGSCTRLGSRARNIKGFGRAELPPDSYAMLTSPVLKKEELVVRGCHSLDDTLVLVCEVLTIPLSYLTR